MLKIGVMFGDPTTSPGGDYSEVLRVGAHPSAAHR
ncbi:DNA recombination/repair protein RecA (plasmid) [Pseudocitrobacter faecalis]|nr:DNA recombination/repair protein RecA [Pseudocitrobacter faecalis]